MRSNLVLAIAAAAMLAAIAVPPAWALAPPNFLIIIADDCTYNDLPVNGGPNVQTPALDRFASEGMVFNKAFLSIAMCNPCRSELYTGLYPARNGACWNHSASRPGTKSIVHYLGDLGYRVGIAGKKHIGPPKVFPFEDVKGLQPSCVALAADYDPSGLKEFMNRDEKPFCLVVALVVPHAPWTVGNPEHFDPATLQLPENLADTPETRGDYAKYLAEIEVLDQQIGQTLEILGDSAKANNTLVLFTSEQGSQFPGNKWTNWNTGVHTTMIARWPGQVPAGKRTGAMVQFNDVLPTLIDIAGGDPGMGDFDGASFAEVLRGNADTHRKYAFFMHNNIPEGPPYPIRAVTDGTYHYVRNLSPDNIYIEKHLMGQNQWHQYWPSWVVDATFNEGTRNLVTRYMTRPPEQLYRQNDDPCELQDLANDPEYAQIKARLSAKLDEWMTAQGDPGALIDTEAQWQASKQGKHFKRMTP